MLHKISKWNWPLLLAVGGCLGFGIAFIDFSGMASDHVTNLQLTTVKMVIDSYKVGCVVSGKKARGYKEADLPNQELIDYCKQSAIEYAEPIRRLMEGK